MVDRFRWWMVLGAIALVATGCGARRHAKVDTSDLPTKLANLESRLEVLETRQREIEQKAWDVQYLKGKVEGTSSQIRQVVVTGSQQGEIDSKSMPTPRQIQMALKEAGFYTGKIDGKIGPKTTQAIREFQRQHNLKADGKVGPKTWQALRPYLVGE
jgi:murein L,D-transpeptidase YcbB/YkuD